MVTLWNRVSRLLMVLGKCLAHDTPLRVTTSVSRSEQGGWCGVCGKRVGVNIMMVQGGWCE